MLEAIAPSLISGGAGIIGSVLGGHSAADTNRMAAEEAALNRKFQERMYKNRHTYEVEDLRRAGLNPILSANSAASAPMGSMANFDVPYKNAGTEFLNSAKSFADVALTKELQKTERTKQMVNVTQANATAIEALYDKFELEQRERVAGYEKTSVGRKVMTPISMFLNAIGKIFHASAKLE